MAQQAASPADNLILISGLIGLRPSLSLLSLPPVLTERLNRTLQELHHLWIEVCRGGISESRRAIDVPVCEGLLQFRPGCALAVDSEIEPAEGDSMKAVGAFE